MSPQQLRAARREMGLTTYELAEILRMGVHGSRTVRRWEDGELPVTGPASVAIEALLTGWRPAPNQG